MSDEIVIQDAPVHDRPPQLGIATMTDRLPNRITSALEVLRDFGVHLVTGGGLGAAELAHHRRIAAIGPPIEGMINVIHETWFLT